MSNEAMMDGASGEAIYQGVKDGMFRVARLSDPALRALIGHVARKGKHTGKAGRIATEAGAQAILRFMKQGGEKP